MTVCFISMFTKSRTINFALWLLMFNFFLHFQGYVSICGMSKNIGVHFPEDAVLVKVLKMQGAVPFMKTNVPQAMYR